MRYSVEGDGYGVTPPGPVRVVDADGVEVLDVVACDTATGAVKQLLRDDADGGLVVDLDAGEVQTVWRTRPAPLAVVPVEIRSGGG